MRRESREIAMHVLFHKEFEKEFQIREFLSLYDRQFNEETLSYAQILVDGCKEHSEKIDQLINSASNQWKIERMSSVDRNILRLSVFEMKFSSQIIPPHVAINEALEIAKKYSAAESISFINGVLDQVAKR
jgi:transcription antitermination protein NusB